MWYWTLKERRGMTVLVLLVVCTRSFYFFWPGLTQEVKIEYLDLDPNSILMVTDSQEDAVEKVIQRRIIKEVLPQRKISQAPIQRKGTLKIGVNTAGAEDWMKIRGIGPVLSKRIIKFREALGGFCTIEQVGQTYGLADSVFQGFKGYLFLDQPCNRININQMDWQQLVRHPYIDSRQANAILRWIDNRGPIEDLEQLRQTEIFDSTTWQQLLPYLKIMD